MLVPRHGAQRGPRDSPRWQPEVMNGCQILARHGSGVTSLLLKADFPPFLSGEDKMSILWDNKSGEREEMALPWYEVERTGC